MAFKNIFLSLSLVLFAAAAFGQKVKYKDLFLLLNSKQYADAEPFLKKFLKENPDHPNALMYMGIVYQEKSNKDDVLKQTELLQRHIDSAVLFMTRPIRKLTRRRSSATTNTTKVISGGICVQATLQSNFPISSLTLRRKCRD